MISDAEDRCRVRPYVLANAAVAAWLVLGQLHRLHSCDSVIFTLIGLQEWTPFFWEQDRVGMLTALLVCWIRDPFVNLTVHTGLMAFSGLTLPLVLGRLASRDRRTPMLVTLGNAIFLWKAPDVLHDAVLIVCVYPLALTLGVCAVLLLDGPRGNWLGLGTKILGVLALLALAHWTYLAIAVFLSVAIAIRAWTSPQSSNSDSRIARLAGPLANWRVYVLAICTGVAVAGVFAWMFRLRASDPGIVPVSTKALPAEMWMDSFVRFFAAAADYPMFVEWVLSLAVPSSIGLAIGLIRNPRGVLATAIAVLPLLVASLVEVAFNATREWPALNQHHPRYLLALFASSGLAMLLVGWLPLLQTVLAGRRATVAGWLAVVLLFGAATIRYGFPDPVASRDELDRFGIITDEAISEDCDGIGGEPFVAVPQTFHANMVLYERGSSKVIYYAGSRGKPGLPPYRHRWNRGQFGDRFRLATEPEQLAYSLDQADWIGLTPSGSLERRGDAIVIPMRAKPMDP